MCVKSVTDSEISARKMHNIKTDRKYLKHLPLKCVPRPVTIT